MNFVEETSENGKNRDAKRLNDNLLLITFRYWNKQPLFSLGEFSFANAFDTPVRFAIIIVVVRIA